MFARTERLLLRPGWAEDAPAIAQAIGDEMIVRNITSAPWPYGPDDAAAFLQDWTSGHPTRFLMIQRTASAPRLIGAIGLESAVAGSAGAPELGYWVARPYWGLGFATEAGRHMVELARTLGHRQIQATHFSDNPASGAVLRKLGFCATGRRLPRFSAGRGAVADSVEYAHDLGSDSKAEGPATASAMRCENPWPSEKREAWRMHAA